MKNIPIVLLSFFVLLACSTEQATSTTNDLTLNDGEKWQVNEEMKPHIEQAEAVLKAYVLTDSQEHKALAKNLKEHNTNLIKSCTMKGKSHEELHKWLIPHVGLVDELANASNTETSAHIIRKLETSFSNYHSFFD